MLWEMGKGGASVLMGSRGDGMALGAGSSGLTILEQDLSSPDLSKTFNVRALEEASGRLQNCPRKDWVMAGPGGHVSSSQSHCPLYFLHSSGKGGPLTLSFPGVICLDRPPGPLELREEG